jgi:hypothetical protein
MPCRRSLPASTSGGHLRPPSFLSRTPSDPFSFFFVRLWRDALPRTRTSASPLQNNEATLIEAMKLNTGTTNILRLGTMAAATSPQRGGRTEGPARAEGRRTETRRLARERNDTGDGARHGMASADASAGRRRSSMATWKRGAVEEDEPQPSDHVARPNLRTIYIPLRIGCVVLVLGGRNWNEVRMVT